MGRPRLDEGSGLEWLHLMAPGDRARVICERLVVGETAEVEQALRRLEPDEAVLSALDALAESRRRDDPELEQAVMSLAAGDHDG